MKGEMTIFIENLKKEIIALKKEKEQNDLRQRAKESLFGQVSVAINYFNKINYL